MQKKLILALSGGLAASLLVIAFLAGRITARAPVIMRVESQPVRPAEPTIAAPKVEHPPREVEQDTLAFSVPQPESLQQKAPVISREAVTQLVPVIPPAGSSPQSAIASYFAKIDAIPSAGSGDPMTFAQGIVGGLQAGDTSAFDSFVNNAKTALAKTTAVQPPPECAEYHRRLLESLSESVVGMEKMRSALISGDISVLASLTSQFQNIQQKVDGLDRMRQQLLGR